MDNSYVNPAKMKTLEDYVTALVLGLITIETLKSYQVQAVNLGILKEDQECRLNSILWDLKRLQRLFEDQANSVLELLPDDFNIQAIMDNLKSQEIQRARSFVRKKNENKKTK